jgi:hypothetical protein
MELMPNASEWADEFLKDHPETQTRCDRVSDLIAGFETPFGMEFLASVHWVASREGATSKEEVVPKLYEWNERKRMFKERQVRIAFEILRNKGWLAKPESAMDCG